MNIEKFVSYQIEKQFPVLFREDGAELVELVKYYYEFLEETSNQSIYNNRRLFEYRDIDNTLENMVIYFKNKYMKDLPLSSDTTRFVVKNILDLYRRRGTTEGIELFFRLFYSETIDIYYPSEAILKPSSSNWNDGVFLQLYPTDIEPLGNLANKTVYGSISKAEAVVDRVLFILVNNVLTPILFLGSVRGTFRGFDDIFSSVDGGIINFGRVYGSLDSVSVQQNDPLASTGNLIGDIVNITQEGARGGKAIVTEVSQNITGEIEYFIEDSGFGYTKENTLLLVSNQIIFSDDLFSKLNVLEELHDQNGNQGIVIGGNKNIVGVKMEEGLEFTPDSIIATKRSSNNDIIIVDNEILAEDNLVILNKNVANTYFSTSEIHLYESIVSKNSTSPGPLYPEVNGANTDILAVKLDELDNEENISLITDRISNFLNVSLDSVNYNDPPAIIPMSGIADPVTIDTPLNEAFDLEPFVIGSLKRFININPGRDYINRVFAVAYDPVMVNFDVYNQIITLETISSIFEVGGIITQGSVSGRIINISGNTLFVLPYSYYGFKNGFIDYNGRSYNIISVSRNYNSNKIGNNSYINAVTRFAVGKISSVNIINSGYGYTDKGNIFLTDEAGEILGVGIASARGQGKIEGRWSSKESHLNFQEGKVIQDSDFYQEFSYRIASKIGINTYKNTLTDIAHLAGTKMFGEFILNDTVKMNTNIRSSIIRNN
jgi:hypothetical protein